MKKLLYLADSVESTDIKGSNSEWVAHQLGWSKRFRLDFIALFEDYHGTVEQLTERVASADAILFDMGGMSLGYVGGSGDRNIDHWNRFFIKTIEEFPNKPWFCISSLDLFDPPDKVYLKELGVHFYWDDH